MRHAFRVEGNPILLDQASKLSKIANPFTAIVRSKETAIDTMQSMVSYARALDGGCGEYFVILCIMSIEEDIMSSCFLAASSRAVFIQYNSVGKIINKHWGMLYLLVEFAAMLRWQNVLPSNILITQVSIHILMRSSSSSFRLLMGFSRATTSLSHSTQMFSEDKQSPCRLASHSALLTR